jgi:hypothetical protein
MEVFLQSLEVKLWQRVNFPDPLEWWGYRSEKVIEDQSHWRVHISMEP